MCLDHSEENADGPGTEVPIILGKAVAPGTSEKPWLSETAFKLDC